MSSPVLVSEECLEALHHVKEKREVNTAVLRLAGGALVPEAVANWTHEELIQCLPLTEPRLVVHELAFATPGGARRNEPLLIFWMPSDAVGQEVDYTAAYTALRELLTDVHVHLTARRPDQLAYRRLVALAG
ncbi:cofilin family protein [Streptomyces sp. NPDC031705]|uniref:cofilin family protein n=1 Tax=Streptomyces sp. NPDC031705 TaxID=3155729 RepID=UPI0033F125DD